MVNPATTRPEQPCKRPPLRGMLAIRTERSPHVLIHTPGTAASSRSIAKQNYEYDAEPQHARANAPGQAEARVREHTRGPSSCAMSGLRSMFAPRVTNVNVQN